MGKGIKTLGVIVLIAIILCLAYASVLLTSGKTSAIFVKLTDPPYAPRGTQDLNITYSSLQVQISNSSGSAWITGYAVGSADLLSLENMSKTIAKVDVPSGSRVETVRLNLTSAEITINGTTYPLALPSSQPSASVSSTGPSNSSASLLVGLSPTIVTIFTLNSTLFVMVPSLKGVMVPNGNASVGVNGVERINSSTISMLAGSAPSISITAASLTASGNRSSISVTVRDNSNSAVALNHLLISGNESVYLNTATLPVQAQPSFFNLTSGSLLNETAYIVGNVLNQLGSNSTKALTGQAISSINVSKISSLGISGSGKITTGELGSILNLSLPVVSRISSNLNATQSTNFIRNVIGNLTNSSYASSLQGKNLSQLQTILKSRIQSGNLSSANLTNILNLIINTNLAEQANFPKTVRLEQSEFHYLSFVINGNSTLSLPSSPSSLSGSGYLLGQGQSTTLDFNGQILLTGGRVGVNIINGDVYNIRVTGENGSSASINVTAG